MPQQDPNKTILDLKKAIAAFARRSLESFHGDKGDMLLLAINHSKDFAQREVDFEWQLAQVKIPLVNGVGKVTEAREIDDSSVAVRVKSLREAFVLVNGQYTPIPIISRPGHIGELKRQYLVRTQTDNPELTTPVNQMRCVRMGMKFYLTPFTSTFQEVAFDAIEWIKDFRGDTDQHWLLDYCFDFMMFRSLYELNYLLKEDARFPISMSVLGSTWDNVKGWNATHIQNHTEDTVTLD